MKDECGVFGVYSNDESFKVSGLIYTGLYMIQHRGQESSGMAINGKRKKIIAHKGFGLVSEVFDDFVLNTLKGNIGIGHVLYSKADTSNANCMQPIVLKYMKGDVAVACNGSLINSSVIKSELEEDGYVFKSSSDAEIIAALLAKHHIENDTLEESLLKVVTKIKGAFSLLVTTDDKMIAVRDENGFRPLCFGSINNGYIISSESVALNPIGAEFIRDINPGEILIIDKTSVKSINYKKDKKTSLCIFEHVYFARPDSKIDNASVYSSRVEAGRNLAKEFKIDADIVIGVPDSGLPSALGYSRESGVPYAEGFIKNRYIGRTFIQPNQEIRDQSVKIKLSVLTEQVAGKRVIMIDDSIVRGTTSKKIVNLLKEAGAKEVHVLISSPPVKFPCYMGVDTPDKEGLIANTYSTKELCEKIEADSLYFLSINGLKKSPLGSKIKFCKACFDGKYPINIDEKGIKKC